MEQVIQITGALMVLAAFILVQARKLDPASRIYLILNAAGSGILAIDALLMQEWGFVLLEGVWALVSVWGLVKPGKGVLHQVLFGMAVWEHWGSDPPDWLECSSGNTAGQIPLCSLRLHCPPSALGDGCRTTEIPLR
ncbi:CBU_0592 family membrane protein [Deinococcus roseus]|uniref:CBU-0592-like domain-containing protein n=1 Tax=Deinococcus roseus TaxID=392414 RepID=A0ABQ2CXT5_9DEIO|nr:hypothetical protein [Deinococcus roseus]GGJ31531.1 hypothetical protein GCM10008938_17140 [Deinococcus roseus]